MVKWPFPLAEAFQHMHRRQPMKTLSKGEIAFNDKLIDKFYLIELL